MEFGIISKTWSEVGRILSTRHFYIFFILRKNADFSHKARSVPLIHCTSEVVKL